MSRAVAIACLVFVVILGVFRFLPIDPVSKKITINLLTLIGGGAVLVYAVLIAERKDNQLDYNKRGRQ